MSKFAHYDTDGFIRGFFDDAIHDAIPEPHVPIDDDTWQGHISNAAPVMVDVKRVTRPLVAYKALPVPLDELKAIAVRRMVSWIDALTGQLRQGYGEDEVRAWSRKADEARAVLAGGTAGPLLQREANRRGVDIKDLAQRIDAYATAYDVILGEVAGIRGNADAAINAARSIKGVEAAMNAALAEAIAAAKALGVAVPASVQ